MLTSVSIIYPRTYFTQVQFPSLVLSFFTLTESFIYPGKDGKSHLRAHIELSNTWCFPSGPPCTPVITSSIYQSIWVRLYRMWVGPGPVSGILVMALYPGTGSDMCTRAFVTSISVSENAQKNLGESTHPIGSTISMHMMRQLPSTYDGMT